MPHLIFLRHGARPPRPAPGVRKPDLLTPTGEAQARAVGPLLAAHDLIPTLALHTRTARTAETTRLALADLDVPRRAVSGGPITPTSLIERVERWCARFKNTGPVALCAHHRTQQMLCDALDLPVEESARALIVVDIDSADRDALRLVLAWSCPEDETTWRSVFPT